MLPIKVGFRELHKFLPSDHALYARLKATVQKGLVQAPAVTDLLFVCADDLGADLMMRLPHGYVPVLRQVREDRSPVGKEEDLASLASPPRGKGHRQEMILCYKTGSVGTRVPVSDLRMVGEGELSKADEPVRCLCGSSVPQFDGMCVVAVRSRFEGTAVRSVTAVKPMLSSIPKGYVAVSSNGEDFNFGASPADALILAIKIV